MAEFSLMRKQFEHRYPVPRGVKWDSASKGYVCDWTQTVSVEAFAQYIGLWSCWKSSRAALVIDLREEINAEENPHGYEAAEMGWYCAIEHCKKALGALGLSVGEEEMTISYFKCNSCNYQRAFSTDSFSFHGCPECGGSIRARIGGVKPDWYTGPDPEAVTIAGPSSSPARVTKPWWRFWR